ncbi:hypothetical protein VTO42DRAFT_2285 [Malbranchea cinnamomea]
MRSLSSSGIAVLTLGLFQVVWPGASAASGSSGEDHHHPHYRDTLRFGSPESVGLLSEPLRELVANLSGYTRPANYGDYTHGEVHPIEPGSANLVAHNSVIVSHFAVGDAVLYADVNGTLLPQWKRRRARRDTLYDLASLTKMFTTMAALQQIDAGVLDLDAPVASYIPEFAVNGKENITIKMLTTHVSGFDADPDPPLYAPDYSTTDERVQAVITQKLIDEPGTVYKYSDLNYMTLMLVLEKVTGKKLDELILDFTSALGMKDTFFNRGNIEGPRFPPYARMAAQEFQIDVQGPSVPKRPQPVRGTVHDENAWALDGVSGHAGLFSTVADTAKMCQMLLNNGTYGGRRILKPETVDLIFTNFLGEISPDTPRGVGFQLNHRPTAGPMASMLTASHTGFTGTSMVIDRSSNTFFLHFANRVHPSRQWSDNGLARQALGYWVAKSLGRDVEFPSLE